MTLPPFIIKSITLVSNDTIQDDATGRTLEIEFESEDLVSGWFPIIKKADGFAANPDEFAKVSEMIGDICRHNDEAGKALFHS